jgi:AraC family transcriptional regulator, positive regulator of tynA and feaB
MLVLKVAAGALRARFGSTRRLTACCVKPASAEASLTSTFLAALPAHVGQLSTGAEDIIRTQVLDLITLCFGKGTEGQATRTATARSLTVLRVQAVIEARLDDPALDSDTVAAASGVSVRYANSLLAGEGMSIMRLVQTRRLERCRQALGDPAQMHRTVSEVAYAWGFSNMTHFGRRFKIAYGMTPSEYAKRKRCREVGGRR